MWGASADVREIAEDITAYFAVSEQIPTACALGVLVDTDQSVLCAGGYLIQLLPGADESVAGIIEQGITALGPVTAALQEGAGPEELLKRALPGFALETVEKTPVEYRCSCSKERVARALVSMGRRELEELIAEQGGARITCQFCDREYSFTEQELTKLLGGL
jgi:molecular chaperone Hsp33